MQVRLGKRRSAAGQLFPPRLGGGLEVPDRRGAGRALEAGRLGAEAFGGGRPAGAGRTLGEERPEVVGLAFGAGVLDGARRAPEVGLLLAGALALGAARRVGPVRVTGSGRLRVVGRTFGVVRRVGVLRTVGFGRLDVAGRAFGLDTRVGVARVLGGAPGRVLNFGGAARVVAGFVSSRGRGRRVVVVFPGRRPPSPSPALAREPRGTALDTGRPRSLRVAFDLGSSL